MRTPFRTVPLVAALVVLFVATFVWSALTAGGGSESEEVASAPDLPTLSPVGDHEGGPSAEPGPTSATSNPPTTTPTTAPPGPSPTQPGPVELVPPPAPDLAVEVTDVDLGTNSFIGVFAIQNAGDAWLEWTFTSDDPRMYAQPAQGNLAPAQGAPVLVVIDGSQLPLGTTVLTGTFSGGGETVPVSVTVRKAVQIELPILVDDEDDGEEDVPHIKLPDPFEQL